MHEEEQCCLLIGNSRWHWALKKNNKWQFINTSIKDQYHQFLEVPLLAWAAVGEMPTEISLDPLLEVKIEEIPLQNCPNWLGIDRALAAWGAFYTANKALNMHPNGLLIADAGTILSITRISANGQFIGGQLIPGLHLQLTSMATGTKNLIYPSIQDLPTEAFPLTTEAAMLQGTYQALLGTLIEAHQKANVPIWLCGGDAPVLIHGLKQRKIEVIHHPNLVLEGMLNLRNHSL
tara:strand:- start:476 stop:1177 length:702 start_codon:yes stop_codon:yes gene_type:complete